jgi:hypothetical protein
LSAHGQCTTNTERFAEAQRNELHLQKLSTRRL